MAFHLGCGVTDDDNDNGKDGGGCYFFVVHYPTPGFSLRSEPPRGSGGVLSFALFSLLVGGAVLIRFGPVKETEHKSARLHFNYWTCSQIISGKDSFSEADLLFSVFV